MNTTPERIVRCRVLNKQSNPCTAEAVDPNAELLICTRHLAEAVRLWNDAKARLTAKAAA